MIPEPARPGSDGVPDPESQGDPGSPAGRDASAQPAQAQDDQQPDERQPAGQKRARRSRPFWRDLVIIVIAALALTVVLKAFVVQVFSIPSQSMENTLLPGDRVLVNKLVYRFRDIARGDVIVFSGQGSWGPDAPPPPSNPLDRFWDDVKNLVGVSAPGTDYIKRVIGLPGDHVACCDAQGRVTVNGIALDENSYIFPGNVPSQVPFNLTVPAGRLWVMGDNRADSDDSRYRQTAPGEGTIPESAVVGRAFLIIWPPSRITDLPIPNTFQQAGFRAAAAAAAATAPPAAVGGGAAVAAGTVVAWRRRRHPRERRRLGSRGSDGRIRRAVLDSLRFVERNRPEAVVTFVRSRDTLNLMNDDGAAWREGTGGARMSGSGSREGFGSPPWDPAEPVPGLDDNQGLPGLGGASGPSRNNGRGGPYGPGGAPGQGSPYGPGASGQGGASGPGGSGWHGSDALSSTSGQVRLPSSGPGAGTWQGGGQQPGPGQPPTGTPGGPGQGDDGAKPDDGPRKDAARPRGRRRRRRSFMRELPVLIVVALVLALVIKTYAIQAFFIPSGSMENTLEVGDRVLINKLVYDFRGIHRGDIVVFDGNGSWDFNEPPASSNIISRFWGDIEGIVGISHDSTIYIKRVIGIPGDHVACCNAKGQVTVNGVPLSEQSYLYPGNAASLPDRFNITVAPGRLWVMGDHRAISYDSRGHTGDPGGGTIPESAVLGRAFVIIWPPSRWGFLNIPATFEQPKLNASAAAAGGSSATLAAAMDNGTPVRQAGSVLPLALGFAGAVPLTWLQRRTRRRLFARRR